MYSINNIVYSDAGYILKSGDVFGYQFDSSKDVIEQDVDLNNIEFRSGYVLLDGIPTRYNKSYTYADLKRDMIHRRYSNDDQLAIVLNKDDDWDGEFKYTKMQEWRNWSGTVAKAIVNAAENNK